MADEGCPECDHCKQKAKDVVCNLCGETCAITRGDGFVDIAGLTDVSVSGGYHSTPGNGGGALDDGSRYEFALCEFCLDWLFQQFKVPVSVVSYMEGGKLEWTPARERVERDEWRKQKERFFAEHYRRAAARKKETSR